MHQVIETTATLRVCSQSIETTDIERLLTTGNTPRIEHVSSNTLAPDAPWNIWQVESPHARTIPLSQKLEDLLIYFETRQHVFQQIEPYCEVDVFCGIFGNENDELPNPGVWLPTAILALCDRLNVTLIMDLYPGSTDEELDVPYSYKSMCIGAVFKSNETLVHGKCHEVQFDDPEGVKAERYLLDFADTGNLPGAVPHSLVVGFMSYNGQGSIIISPASARRLMSFSGGIALHLIPFNRIAGGCCKSLRQAVNDAP